jgi:ABC-type multidrug transport system permease subunit
MSTPHAPEQREQYSPLLELVRVRFLEFLREPEAVFWTFIFPILLAGGLGIAFRSRPADVVKVAIAESSAGADSLRTLLTADSLLDVAIVPDSTIDEAIRLGRYALVLSHSVDGPTITLDEAREEARNARLLVQRALQPVGSRVKLGERRVSERGSRYIDFVLPGLLGMNLMGSSIWGIGFSIVDARRKKLLKRMVATPMSRSQYLMSFVLMRLCLMIVEIGVITGFGVLVFGVPMRGSWFSFAAIALSGTLAFGAMGLLIASRAQTVEAASGMMNIVMLPMWVASGVFFAATNFPAAVQPVIQALPLTAAVDALRLNMLQGANGAALLPELGILWAWMLVAFVAALRLFRWK